MVKCCKIYFVNYFIKQTNTIVFGNCFSANSSEISSWIFLFILVWSPYGIIVFRNSIIPKMRTFAIRHSPVRKYCPDKHFFTNFCVKKVSKSGRITRFFALKFIKNYCLQGTKQFLMSEFKIQARKKAP